MEYVSDLRHYVDRKEAKYNSNKWNYKCSENSLSALENKVDVGKRFH